IDTDLMNEYVDYLKDIKVNRSGAPMMMVYDSFTGHLEKSVKEKFRNNGIDLAVILAGLTSVCQPLDVAINKLFKDNLCKEWHLWISHGGAGTTAKGNLRRASFSDVCWWVKYSWKGISNEVIIKSFKACGITNSLVNQDDSDKENDYEELEIIDLTI
ncbi:14328_t:CDS:1, partial [Racocetra persica]